MAISDFELHPDRLSTTDAKGRRIYVQPADVRGFFRDQRTYVQAVLILFFLALPWLKIHSRQAVLFDFMQRRFELFGLSLRAHNAPLLIFVLGAAGFGLFFATAVFGRVWCGWACPQTVFIDGVFRRIERWIEGPALTRRQLDQAPLSLKKAWLRTFKWSLYTLVTLVITHSFLAYFVGTDHLAIMIRRPPHENWGSFLFMLGSTALILFDFAWFREQFCTILCPYGRFQSVLMDKKSMIVAYDVARGEPRSQPKVKGTGDCVNCYRCVQVCPTGIDIRRGVQLECIACTACIDACDEVMAKINKPKGLIRYDSLANMESTSAKKPTPFQFSFTLRAGVYLGLCLFSLSALLFAFLNIKPVTIEVLRAKDTPYSTQPMEDGRVMVTNHFRLELSNQSGFEHEFEFGVPERFKEDQIQVISAIQPFPLADGKITQTDVFVRFPKRLLVNGQQKIQLRIKDRDSKNGQTTEMEKEVTLVGPFQ